MTLWVFGDSYSVDSQNTTGNILAVDIRSCADRLHELSIIDNRVNDIIKKAKL